MLTHIIITTLVLLIGIPAATYLYAALTGVIDKVYYQYVTWGFYTGTRLRRQAELGNLNKAEILLSYVFVLFSFLPSDFGLSAIVSRQMRKLPRPKLTTTLVAETLGCASNTLESKRNKVIALALRELMDDHNLTTLDVIKAATALDIFDIIDTKAGDTGHFRNANHYRSRNDPDLEAE
jgi:hypothetical protein